MLYCHATPTGKGYIINGVELLCCNLLNTPITASLSILLKKQADDYCLLYMGFCMKPTIVNGNATRQKQKGKQMIYYFGSYGLTDRFHDIMLCMVWACPEK
jgi:hypothetical protein